jgi:hypothetical protein
MTGKEVTAMDQLTQLADDRYRQRLAAAEAQRPAQPLAALARATQRHRPRLSMHTDHPAHHPGRPGRPPGRPHPVVRGHPGQQGAQIIAIGQSDPFVLA